MLVGVEKKNRYNEVKLINRKVPGKKQLLWKCRVKMGRRNSNQAHTVTYAGITQFVVKSMGDRDICGERKKRRNVKFNNIDKICFVSVVLDRAGDLAILPCSARSSPDHCSQPLHSYRPQSHFHSIHVPALLAFEPFLTCRSQVLVRFLIDHKL